MDAVAVAEANVADERNATQGEKTVVNGEGENKFQKAISAWRSRSLTPDQKERCINKAQALLSPP